VYVFVAFSTQTQLKRSCCSSVEKKEIVFTDARRKIALHIRPRSSHWSRNQTTHIDTKTHSGTRTQWLRNTYFHVASKTPERRATTSPVYPHRTTMMGALRGLRNSVFSGWVPDTVCPHWATMTALRGSFFCRPVLVPFHTTNFRSFSFLFTRQTSAPDIFCSLRPDIFLILLASRHLLLLASRHLLTSS